LTTEATPTEKYLEVQRSDEFAGLRRKLRNFIFPVTVAFFLWYALYVLLSAYARDFMAIRLIGTTLLSVEIAAGPGWLPSSATPATTTATAAATMSTNHSRKADLVTIEPYRRPLRRALERRSSGSSTRRRRTRQSRPTAATERRSR